MEMGPILITLGKLLEQVPQGCTSRYHICWWGGKLCCLPSKHTDKDHTVFRNVTDNDARYGFNSRQWNYLACKVYDFFEENNL